MYYIAKYISKEENVILRPDIKDALSAINDAPQKEFVSKVMKATKLITSHRVRSGQETAYVTVSLPLRGSTHSTVFVNTRGRDKRNRILRKECINNDEQTEFSESDFASDMPFRDEDNLLQGYANAKECFKAKFDMLQPGNILITHSNQ